MQKILLAAFVGASVLVSSAFAQVDPAATGAEAQSSTQAHSSTQALDSTQAQGSTQAGIPATGMPSNIGNGGDSHPSGTPALGLGDLLKQAQADDPSRSTDTANDGTEPAANAIETKARAKARAHGH